MSEPKEKSEKSIPAEDVDDVVGVASELERADEQRVRVEEMKEIAADLEIDPKYVEPAIDSLEKQREEERRARAAALVQRRRVLARVGIALGAIVLLTSIGVIWTRSALATAWADVEAARAQVANVIERRERVEGIWRDRPPGLDRDAELAGAENRVGIERRRYDQAASAYNAEAGGVVTSLFCGLAAVPCRAPMSSEIERW